MVTGCGGRELRRAADQVAVEQVDVTRSQLLLLVLLVTLVMRRRDGWREAGERCQRGGRRHPMQLLVVAHCPVVTHDVSK